MKNINLEILKAEQKKFDENRVRAAMKNLLERIDLLGAGATEQFSYQKVMDIVVREAGDYLDWYEKRVYTKNIRRTVAILAEEIADFARQDNAAGKSRLSRIRDIYERMDHYSVVFQKVFASGSPCVLSTLSDREMFKVIVSYDQIPNLDSDFCNGLFHEMVYNVSGASHDYLDKLFKDIYNDLNSSNVSGQVAIIKKIAEFGEKAVNAMYESGSQLTPFIINFLEKISDETKIPLVGIVASASEQQLRALYDFDQYGEVSDIEFRYLIDNVKSGLKKRYNDALRYKFPKNLCGHNEEVRVISSDYVGLYGDNRRPIELALRKKGASFVDTQKIFNLPTNIPFGSEEKLKNVRYLFEQIQTPLQATTIERLFGIDLSKMSLRSQIQLIDYISEQSVQQYDELIELRRNGKIPDSFYEALFAVNANKKTGEALLECAHNYEPEITDLVCSKYNALIHEIYQIEIMIGNFFADKTKSEVDARRAVQEFSKRAADILLKAAKKPERADEFFASATKDILMFSSIFKAAAQEQQDLQLQDVAGVDVVVCNQHALTTEDKEQMQSIMLKNWEGRHDGLRVMNGFKEYLASDTPSTLYVLKRGGAVVAFVRYDEMHDEQGKFSAHEKYGGSFNVDPAYKSSALGSALLDTSMRTEASSANITSIIDLDYDFAPRYIERFGFVVVRPNVDTTEKLDGFVMRFDHTLEGRFASRAADVTAEEIIAGHTLFDVVKFNVTPNKPDFFAARDLVAARLAAGEVLTRFIVDPHDTTKRYAVFEKM